MKNLFLLTCVCIGIQAYCASLNIISFYRKNMPFYELTNFWMAPIMIHGTLWPSTEHYFQAQKFINLQLQEKIRKLKTCMQAFYFVRNPKIEHLIRKDWHKGFKERVMLDALRAKFNQHANLKALLLATGDAILIEDSHNDYYWGDPHTFDPRLSRGKNQLGVLLMQVRQELRSQEITE